MAGQHAVLAGWGRSGAVWKTRAGVRDDQANCCVCCACDGLRAHGNGPQCGPGRSPSHDRRGRRRLSFARRRGAPAVPPAPRRALFKPFFITVEKFPLRSGRTVAVLSAARRAMPAADCRSGRAILALCGGGGARARAIARVRLFGGGRLRLALPGTRERGRGADRRQPDFRLKLGRPAVSAACRPAGRLRSEAGWRDARRGRRLRRAGAPGPAPRRAWGSACRACGPSPAPRSPADRSP